MKLTFGVATPWPLIGRDEELGVIAQALASRDSGGIVLAGAAGLGKSRLTRESLALAENLGWATVWVAGLKALSPIPLGAFAQLPVAHGTGDQRELLRSAARALALQAGSRRLALGIDDAHLLDATSAALVHHLAATRAAFVIAAVRTGEPVPDPIVALWKDDLTDRLELQALSDAEVSRLVRDVLSGYVEDTTAHELWRVSGGNPLYLRELVLSGLGSGQLDQDGGVWRWKGPLAEGQRLSEVIEGRLGDLDTDERRVLDVLAVAETLSVGALETLQAPGTPLADGVLTALETKGLVTVNQDGRRSEVSLTHPLYGEVMRSHARLRTRSVKSALADHLRATGARRREDLLRMATWLLDAGRVPEVDVALSTARSAAGLGDHQLAERLALAAVDAGGGFPARVAWAEALAGQRRGAEAEAALAQLAADAASDVQDEQQGQQGQHEHLARLAMARATNLTFNLGSPADGDRVLAEGGLSLPPGPWRDELALMRANFLIFGERLDDAAEAVIPILDRPEASDPARLRALVTAATVWVLKGRLAAAATAIDEGLTLAAELHQDLLAAGLEALRSMALVFGGHPAEAETLAVERYDAAIATNRLDSAGMLAPLVGFAPLFQGRAATAERRLSQALPLLREHDRFGMHPMALAFLAHAASVTGHLEVATAAVAEVMGPGMLPTHRTWVGIGRAWVAAASGDLSVARTLAVEAADAGRHAGFSVGEALALHEAIRLGAGGDVTDRLVAMDPSWSIPVVAACASHAAARAAGDGHGLDAAAADFERMGFLLWAAEASAEAEARHRRAGLVARAESSSARARALAARCEGAVTPALAALMIAAARPLTERERQIARLAAEGLSSRQIAERLVLSIRTVDTHLGRVYTKLGVSSREQLRGLIT